MADVSIRSYLKKVDSLIEQGAYEEAKAQTRHILTYYAKNAHAYRNLGRVLVAQGQWQEAGEVLRRLLGAMPLDVVAHQLLSAVYDKLGQPEQALFHLERAFDQQPNDKTIIARLREMYASYRKTQVEKIQLTAGAVAGQYINNNMPDQAIDILQKAVRRFPERVDLQIQLARAFWASNQKVEAAETALEVLKQIPYAVAANRILAELWLEQGRPSDARPYLTRIEDVDPYLALRLATGETDENRYALPELDYHSVTQRQLSTSKPDWLSNIDDSSLANDDMAWLTAEAPQAVQPPQPKRVTDGLPDLLDDVPTAGSGSEVVPDTFSGGLSPEVMARIDAIKRASSENTVIASASAVPSANVTDSDVDDFAADSNDWMKDLGIEIDENATGEYHTGLTGLLSKMDDEEEEGTPDFFGNLEQYDEPVNLSSEASLDFLSDIDARPTLSPQSGRISTGLTDFIVESEEPDADFFDEGTDDFDVPSVASVDDDFVPANDAHNPLAWMQGSDIEFDEHAEDPFEAAKRLEDDEDVAIKNRPKVDPMAWMRDSDIELHEDAYAEEDPMAWMQSYDDDDDVSNLPDFLEEQPSSASDWLDNSGALDEMQFLESLTTDEFAAVLNAQGESKMSDETDWTGDDGLDGFEWLSDDSELDEKAIPSDWIQPVAEPSNELDWMQEDPADSAFAWGNELDPSAETETGFTGMLDNLQGALDTYAAQKVTDDSMAWMEEYTDDNIAFEASPMSESNTDLPDDWQSILGVDAEDDFGDMPDELVLSEFDSTFDDNAGVADAVAMPDFSMDNADDFSMDDAMFEDYDGAPIAEEDPLAWMYASDIELDDELEGSDVPMASNGVTDANALDFGMDAMPTSDFDLDDELAAEFGITDDQFTFDEQAVATGDFDFGNDFEPVSDEFNFGTDIAEAPIDNRFAFDSQDVADNTPDWLANVSGYDDGTLAQDDLSFGDELMAQDQSALGDNFLFSDELAAQDEFGLGDDFAFGDEELVAQDEFGLGDDLAFGDELVTQDEFGLGDDLAFGDELVAQDEFGLGDDFAFGDELVAQDELGLGDDLAFGDELVAQDEFGLGDELVAQDEFGLGDDFAFGDELVAQDEFGLGDDLAFGDELVAQDEFGLGDDLAFGDDEFGLGNDLAFGSELVPQDEFGQDDDFAFGEDAVAEDEPDWLKGVGLVDTQAVADHETDVEGFEFDQEAIGEFDQAFDEEEVVEANIPDWLQGVGENDFDVTDDVEEEDNFMTEAVAMDDYDLSDEPLPYDQGMEEGSEIGEGDWLAGLGITGTAAAAVGAMVQNSDKSQTEFDWMSNVEAPQPSGDAMGEDAYTASNAPDWLNAMVPGLDVDYENLPESEVVEDEFASGTSHRQRGELAEFKAVNEDFNWLQDIVDEESQVVAPIAPAPLPIVQQAQPMTPVPPPAVAPLPLPTIAPATAPEAASVAKSARRFIFSRMPAWLVNARETTKKQDASDELDDFDVDDLDFSDFDFDDLDDKK